MKKRVCIFAHWDKDNIIDEYVIYYLQALKEVCSGIIFVSDCNLDASEKEKINDIADFVIAEKHNEYDFGSYKRGFLCALENNLNFDELVFANDSCYGPFYPLKEVFAKMDKKNCDFWGLTFNKYGLKKIEKAPNKICIIPHIQSYFMVLKPQIFNQPFFIEFIKNIKHEAEKDDVIINYEIGLSKLLHEKGYKSSAYINSYKSVNNCTVRKWDSLIKKHRFPLLKTCIIKEGTYLYRGTKNWEKMLNKTSDYPTEFIKTNSERNRDFSKNIYPQMNLYRKIRFRILDGMGIENHELIILIEKNIFKFLNFLCFNRLKKF